MDRFDSVNDTPNYQESDKLNHTFDTQIGNMYNVSKAIAQQDKFIDEIDTRKGYSKTETDDLLNTKANADNVYTKTETDNLLDAKADADDVYTKTETDNLLDAKADADDVYTKTETDNLLNDKADADNVYTKAETNALIPIGTIFSYAGKVVPTGYLWCDGSTFNTTTYAELYSVLGTNTLPDLNGVFLEGTNTVNDIGTTVSAGLPDITGQFDCNSRDGTINNSGAFGRESSGTNQLSNATNIKGKVTVSFKASDGEIHSGTYRNDIYGKSDTVQPNSYKVMYIIKVK